MFVDYHRTWTYKKLGFLSVAWRLSIKGLGLTLLPFDNENKVVYDHTAGVDNVKHGKEQSIVVRDRDGWRHRAAECASLHGKD